MGLTVGIYKNGTDCSNGGLSSRVKELTLVNVDGPFEPTEERPAALLVPGTLPGIARVVPAAEVTGHGAAVEYHGKWAPLLADGDKTMGPSMGGCYVASADSRFVEAVEEITGARFYGAVPLHDRFESSALYRQIVID